MSGHAIEARLYAEDPDHDFLPQIGHLHDFHVAGGEGIRLDSGVETGDEVGIHYDPMLAKLIAHGTTREEANRRLARALARTSVQGVVTNVPFLRAVVAHPAWQAGELSTHFIADHAADLRGKTVDPALAARIATVVDAVTADRGRTLLPDLPLGWRNNRFADPQARWHVGGSSGPVLACSHRALGRGRFATTVGSAAAEVVVLGDDGPTWRLEIDGHARAARVVRAGDHVWVHVDGADLALARVPRFATSHAEDDAGRCTAPMPGKVLAVKVQVGALVAAGDPLVVLEAMKMEHTLEAPAAGRVAEVLVAPGEVVQADQELVRLEEPSGEPTA